MKALVLAVALTVTTTAPQPTAEGVNWAELDVDQAIERAQEESRRVFVIFDATWCGPCKELHRKVLSTPAGSELLASTIAIRADIDEARNKKFVTRYNARVIPTSLVLESDGTEVGRITGFPGRDRWMKRVRNLLGGDDDDDKGLPVFE